MDSMILLQPLLDYVIRESECCCGFCDFVVAIARSHDQSVAVDSAISLWPLPESECCCGFHNFVAAIARLCD